MSSGCNDAQYRDVNVNVSMTIENKITIAFIKMLKKWERWKYKTCEDRAKSRRYVMLP